MTGQLLFHVTSFLSSPVKMFGRNLILQTGQRWHFFDVPIFGHQQRNTTAGDGAEQMPLPTHMRAPPRQHARNEYPAVEKPNEDRDHHWNKTPLGEARYE